MTVQLDRMRVSVSVTRYSWPGGSAGLSRRLHDLARAADDAGFDSLWVPDHLLQAEPGADPDEAMLEAYTTLGYLAAATERIGLGAMVTAVTYRPPALLIKAITTLDVLSGGRAWLGLGAGYQQDEADALGLPLPAVRERFDHLEDTLLLARQMWAGDVRPFHGRRHRLTRPTHSPSPLRRPHPPILVGGTGERRTLPLVARYADACNLFDIPDGGATLRHKLTVLRRLCDDAGRAFEAIEKTVSTRMGPDEDADAMAARLRRLAGLGLDHAVVLHPAPWTTAALSVLAAAVQQVRR
jgi:F420-dependent oxidoreductase-like protein